MGRRGGLVNSPFDVLGVHHGLLIANVLWDADLNDPENDEWLSQWIAEARQDETVDFPARGTLRG